MEVIATVLKQRLGSSIPSEALVLSSIFAFFEDCVSLSSLPPDDPPLLSRSRFFPDPISDYIPIDAHCASSAPTVNSRNLRRRHVDSVFESSWSTGEERGWRKDGGHSDDPRALVSPRQRRHSAGERLQGQHLAAPRLSLCLLHSAGHT